MSLPPATFRAPPLPEPAPIVRVVAAEDTPWQPALFRAPTLEVFTVAAISPTGALKSAPPAPKPA